MNAHVYLGLITKQLEGDWIGDLERQRVEGKRCLVKLKVYAHVLHEKQPN